MPARDEERGAVTAEAAVVLPIMVVLTVGLAWLVALGVAQVRAQDAAREAARVVARGDSVAAGEDYATQVATHGSQVSVRRDGGSVRVTVRSPVRGPGGLFGFLPEVTLEATAVAAAEGDDR